MKVNQLMIGDWVQIPAFNNRTAKVTNIYSNVIHTDMFSLLQENEFEPIILTKEIFEKNGFEYCHEHSYYNHEAYNLGGKIYGVFVADSLFTICAEYYVDEFECTDLAEITIIEYVHELQHALRLCGIDKEIVL